MVWPRKRDRGPRSGSGSGPSLRGDRATGTAGPIDGPDGTDGLRLRDAIRSGALRPIPETLDGARPAQSGPAADIAGVDTGGRPVHVPVSGGAGRWLLVFLSDDCLGCEPFWSELAAWREPGDAGLPLDVRPVIVTKGPGRVSVERLRGLVGPGATVTVVLSDPAWADYGVLAYPTVVVVGGTGEGDVADRASGDAGGPRPDVRAADGAPVKAEPPVPRVTASDTVFEWGDALALIDG